MKHNYINIADQATHVSRSFFVYANGDLFYQFTAREICTAKLNDEITLNMSGAIIHGKFIANHGTGFILSDWTIERKGN